MDLLNAKDHPATLLESNAAPSKPAEPFSDSEFGDREYNFGVSDAAEFLREYEKVHGVTFVALDNAALEYVYDEWRKGVEGFHQSDLYGGVKDLFGLGD